MDILGIVIWVHIGLYFFERGQTACTFNVPSISLVPREDESKIYQSLSKWLRQESFIAFQGRKQNPSNKSIHSSLLPKTILHKIKYSSKFTQSFISSFFLFLLFIFVLRYCLYNMSQLQFYASKHFHFYATRRSILCSDSMTSTPLVLWLLNSQTQ